MLLKDVMEEEERRRRRSELSNAQLHMEYIYVTKHNRAIE